MLHENIKCVDSKQNNNKFILVFNVNNLQQNIPMRGPLVSGPRWQLRPCIVAVLNIINVYFIIVAITVQS